MEKFLKYWFSGFEEAIGKMEEKDRSTIFRECGRACSSSYSRQRYLEARMASGNDRELMEKLKEYFPEMEITVLEEGHVYRIIYRFCACDLVKNKLVSSPQLCECSRYSLLYNWEAISGESTVKAELERSILGGAPYCEFIVSIS